MKSQQCCTEPQRYPDTKASTAVNTERKTMNKVEPFFFFYVSEMNYNIKFAAYFYLFLKKSK